MELMDCSAALQWLSTRVCLDEDGMQVAQTAFTAHKIAGAELLQATMGSLKRAYGISSWGVRLKIMLALDELSSSVKPAPAPAACTGATHGGPTTRHYKLQECNLELLPDGPLVQICSYLAPRDMGMLQCVSCRFACFYEDRPWHSSVVAAAAVCQLRAHPWRGNIWAAAAAICKAERFRLLHRIDCHAQSRFTAVDRQSLMKSIESYLDEVCMDCGARSDHAFDSLVSDLTHDGIFRCRQCEVLYFPEAAHGDEEPLTCMDCGARSDFAADSLISNFTHDGVLRCRQCELWYFPEAAQGDEESRRDAALQKWIQSNCPVLLLGTLCASPAREVEDCDELSLSTDALTSRSFLSRPTHFSGDRSGHSSYHYLTYYNMYTSLLRVHEDGMVAGVHFVEFVLPEMFRGQVGIVGSGAHITGDSGATVWTGPRSENSLEFSTKPFWWKRPVENLVCIDCGDHFGDHGRRPSHHSHPAGDWADGCGADFDRSSRRCYHCSSAYACFLFGSSVPADDDDIAQFLNKIGIDDDEARALMMMNPWWRSPLNWRMDRDALLVDLALDMDRLSRLRSRLKPLRRARLPIEGSKEAWESSTSSTGVLYDINDGFHEEGSKQHSHRVGLLLDIERQTLSVYRDGALTAVFTGDGGELRDKSLHWAVRSTSGHGPVAVERKPAPCTDPRLATCQKFTGSQLRALG